VHNDAHHTTLRLVKTAPPAAPPVPTREQCTEAEVEILRDHFAAIELTIARLAAEAPASEHAQS